MDPMEAIRATFFQECEEGLADLEQGLLAVEAGDHDPETVNAVFRAVHSIKGGAGAFALDDLVRFSHVFETALDRVRSGKLAPEPHIIKVMLRAADILSDFVRAARDGGAVDEGRSQAIAAELDAMAAASAPPVAASAAGPAAEDDGMDGLVFTPLQMDLPAWPELDGGDPLAAFAAVATVPSGWAVRFTPRSALYAKANEAGLLLRELARLGPTEVELDADALPDLDTLDPEGAYLSWTVRLDAAVDEAAVREVFEFVEDDCELEVAPLGAAATPEPFAAATLDPFNLLDSPGAPPEAAPELDVMALIRQAQSQVQAAPAAIEAAVPPVAFAAVADAPTPALEAKPTSASAAPPADAKSAPAAPAPATIRVDLDRVDRLIDLVGELVINQAVLAQRVAEAGVAQGANAGESQLAQSLGELEQLTREIQDSVMAIRAQPVKSVFQRMPRLAREVAAMTGKAVRLVTEGENTEVDKTVIERLADPLTHMLRNAIDHGLESPAKREAAGKPAEGVVKLAAFHRSGRIVIEVSDDGAGIDRQRVRAIAADKGLIPADAQLSDDELDNLIFLPGFSTADTVSDISGRGVGMDVVKRSIAALGGRISITSRPGLGSTFTMSLPLTLAVLDGMVVTIGGQTLIAPLTAIVETLQPRAADVHPLGQGARVIAIRGGYTPLIDVGEALGYREGPLDAPSGVALLIEGEGGARAALLVDAIQGQRQVVIKSLEANYRQVSGIAAATILGDGRVALILDIDALVASARHAEVAAASLAAA